MSESIVIMTIGPLLTIVPNVPPLFVGQPGAISFSATGAEGLLRWTLVSSDLPGEWDAALTIDAGVASLEAATLATPGSYSVRVRLSDATRIPVEQTFSVRIVALPIEVSGMLDAWTVTVAITDVLTLGGGTGDYVGVSAISGALPAGASVALVGDELQFTGSPTASGAWAVVLRVTDSGGAYLDIPLSGAVDVLPLTITGGPLLDATEGEAYSDTITISGGVPPYSLGTVTGLPTGISASISGSTITISGTPGGGTAAASPFSLSIEVEDSAAEAEVYTQSFVVAVNSDPYFSSVVSLLHLDGANGATTFTDVKGKTWLTYGDAKLSTTDPKFGSAALLLDGTGDYAESQTSADWQFGTGDFTVEFWVRFGSTAATTSLLSNYTDSSGGFTVQYRNTGVLRVGWGDPALLDVSWSPSTGVWYHVAVARVGSTIRTFVDGALLGSATNSTNINTNTAFCLGRLGTFALQHLNGRIDEVRITNGVGRYTAAFTPPSAPFPDS